MNHIPQVTTTPSVIRKTKLEKWLWRLDRVIFWGVCVPIYWGFCVPVYYIALAYIDPFLWHSEILFEGLRVRMYRWRTEGFTLVELSIVLVIIGLIVGGIVEGQDMINASAERAQITQIEKYNQAVNTFRDKYNGIPGDLSIPLATQFGFTVPPDCTGQVGGRDGNGLIDGYVNPYAGLMGENALFWLDLYSAKLMDGNVPVAGGTSGWGSNFSGLCTASITETDASTVLPAGKLGYGTLLHVYETRGANWFMLANIASLSGANSHIRGNATIPVQQAYNIDKKIDDGFPTTGNVQAVYINGSQTNTTTAPTPPPTVQRPATTLRRMLIRSATTTARVETAPSRSGCSDTRKFQANHGKRGLL